MPRPKKMRRVALLPQATYFKPAGVPVRRLDEVRLTVEGLEALRLKDVQGLDPEECAQAMRVSRPTFHRVLEAARRRVAEALVGGKALRIEGGDFLPAVLHLRCADKDHQWQVSFEEMASRRALACPECSSLRVVVEPSQGRCRGLGDMSTTQTREQRC